jgi:predicted Rossmann-fold nucleotide-binding protein
MGGASMNATRTKRIIAVFGGDGKDDESVLPQAEALGHAIAKKQQILLTGGTQEATEPVKNRAILGARRPPWIGPWIGVDRRESGGAFSTRRGSGFLICSDLDHMRNYLEAHICDAAIGLRGGNGTISEITSALSLHRPVAFVGSHWKEDFNLDKNRSKAQEDLVAASFKRLNKSRGSDALKEHVTPENILAGLDELPPSAYAYFDSRATARVIIDWIMDVLLDEEGFRGSFPTFLTSTGHDAVEKKYRRWLAEQE